MSPSHTIWLLAPLAPVQLPTNTLPCLLLPRSALRASWEWRGRLWGPHWRPPRPAVTTGPQMSQGVGSVSQCLGRWPLGGLSHLHCLLSPWSTHPTLSGPFPVSPGSGVQNCWSQASHASALLSLLPGCFCGHVIQRRQHWVTFYIAHNSGHSLHG